MSSNQQPSPGEYGPALSGRQTALRLGVIGLVALGAAGAFAYAGGWLSPARLSPDRLVNRLEQVGGHHAGFRRNHAKGVCVAGYFDGNGQGSRLSRAVVFKPGRVPVIGRFALAGGNPYVADTATTVRSLALRFMLPDGEEWRTGMNDIPVFPVSTAEGFYELVAASSPDPATGKPAQAAMNAFLAAHPESGRALAIIKNRTVSSGFDDATYDSLNAFRFVDAAGARIPVRWSMVPVQPVVVEDANGPHGGDGNYLFDELIARVGRQKLQWRLVVTVGQPGDPTWDATLQWPADRARVDVGLLTIDRVAGEATGGCRDINFDPLVLPAGIEASDDPLLSARSATYAKSFTRRAGETKKPSAVTTADPHAGAKL